MPIPNAETLLTTLIAVLTAAGFGIFGLFSYLLWWVLRRAERLEQQRRNGSVQQNIQAADSAHVHIEGGDQAHGPVDPDHPESGLDGVSGD